MENNNEEIIALLKDIQEQGKKKIFWSRISACLLAVFVAVFAISAATLVPRATQTLDTANARLNSLETTITKLETALDSITALTEDTAISLDEAMSNLNSVDFEGLNDAIRDLGDVVSPLASFFGRFN